MITRIRDEEMDLVKGGSVFNLWHPDSKNEYPCVAIDDNSGKVVGRFKTMDEAKARAASLGFSTKEISFSDLQEMSDTSLQ